MSSPKATPEPCKERYRLTEVYLAVAKNIEAIRSLKDMSKPQWRDDTKETREACQDAMDALTVHREEHVTKRFLARLISIGCYKCKSRLP